MTESVIFGIHKNLGIYYIKPKIIMEMPNIPTDNIYKFQAIMGVVCFILALWSIPKQIVPEMEDLMKLNLEVETIQLNMSSLIKEVKDTDVGVASVKNSIEYQKVEQQLYDTNLLFSLKKWYVEILIGCMGAATLVGAFFSLRGFICWENRVQYYLDLSLQNEVKSNIKKRVLEEQKSKQKK